MSGPRRATLPHLRRAAFQAALLCALLPVAAAQSPPTPPAATAYPPAAVTYKISGKVVDAHSGAALGHASVQIADVKARSQSQTVSSRDDGSFVFDGLPQGKYSLTAERPGYLAQSYEEHDQFSTAIAVGPGLQSEGLTFELVAEAILSGSITDEAGEGVRGAQLRLFEDVDVSGTRSTQNRHTVMSDDRGMYEIDGLRPGSYFLVATGRPWYAQHLQPAVVPSGEDSNSEGQALDVAYPATFYPGVTDQDAATPIPVKGGERLEANLTMAALPAMRVRLTVPPGEDATRGVSVMLSQSIFGQTETLPTQTSRNEGGTVEIDGVLPGHYEVIVNRYSSDDTGSGARHFEADISSGASELSDESAVGEIQVKGRVTSPPGAPKPQGGIALRLPHGHRQQYSNVDEEGNFSLSVPPGTYEVVGNLNDLYIGGLTATGARLVGRMLTVKNGDAPKLDILAGSGRAEIDGVALSGDKPASAVMVLLAPEDAGNNQILFRRDQSDSDGTFDIPNVVPGRYRLLAIERGWELEWANPSILQAFLSKSVAVQVKAGDHLTRQTLLVQTR